MRSGPIRGFYFVPIHNMKLTILILSIILIVVLYWGIRYYRWYREHKEDVIMSQARLKRIKELIETEYIYYIYDVKEYNRAYYVRMFNWGTGYIPIKRFYDEDKDYARRCAEELCDKLNEKI